MAEQIISKLKIQRGNVKRQLTNSETLIASIKDETDLEVLELKERLQKHLGLWDAFEKIQDKLDDYSLTEIDIDANELERTHFENRFHNISGFLKRLVNKLPSQQVTQSANSSQLQTETQIINNNDQILSRSPGSVTTSIENNEGSVTSQGNNLANNNSINCNARFEFPKLQTPSFHGNYDTWLTFHDTFKSMCHDNSALSSIQKFHYLRTCLKDEAAEVIASLEITGGNYQIAWDLLKRRYDNRKYIVESHVKSLFDLPSISREFTIRALLDNVQKHVRALKALGHPVDDCPALLVHIIREKLNNYNREKWEESVGSTNLPTFLDMIDFLERRSLIENTQSTYRPVNHQKAPNFKNRGNFSRSPATCITTTVGKESNNSNTSFPCALCSESHRLYTCSQFLNMPVSERYSMVKKANLCHNCFFNNHRTIDCRRGPCHKCNRRHHTLLHFCENPAGINPTNTSAISNQEVATVKVQAQSQSQVVLGTAIVHISDGQGKYIPCRAFLDSCSQCCSISERFATSLGLKMNKTNIALKGVDNLQSNVTYSTTTKIKSLYDDRVKFDISFLIFKEISDPMPILHINRNSLNIPDNLFLADPDFNTSAEVDILIGAEYFYNLMRAGKIAVKGQTAVFQETGLGWIFSGRYVSPKSNSHKISSKQKNTQTISCNLINFQNLPLLWELGDEGRSKFLSEEEKAAEMHYVNNTKRDETGRYTVRLPFNDKQGLLGESKNIALQRFYNLETKFSKNPALKSQYTECIQDYLKQGHMKLIDNQELTKHGSYFPHHAVFKSDSITTKLRVVFDGSAKTSSGISLNETFMLGPVIQDDLYIIITRFRTFPFAFTADIEQMYRQIIVSPENQHFQKIFWRTDLNEPIKTYAMTRVTFGTSCAPYLATRTLHKLADDEKDSFPVASKILKRDFYFDDLLSGAQSFPEALKLRNELINLLSKGGFKLRKWISNDPDLCTDLAHSSLSEHMSLDPTDSVKTLGLHWNPQLDVIFYVINSSEFNEKTTKRALLSQVAKLFDPIGLLGPVIVIGKLLIQQLWKLNLAWDEDVPVEIKNIWFEYVEQLPILNNIKFERCVTQTDSKIIQLHGFCDASEKAYGACLYLRSTNEKGENSIRLICSKSRVCPLKATTLPRLELCAAVLLAKLYETTIKSLNIPISKIIFWSDSTITLNWINAESYSLETFIANRVSEIQNKTQTSSWRHVPSESNPADLLSRGSSPRELLQNLLWTKGPPWLLECETSWPNLSFIASEIPGLRKKKPLFSLKLTIANENLLNKYSSLDKLIRVLAYCLRFINNIKQKQVTSKFKGSLSNDEIDRAEKTVFKLVQAETFSEEMRSLSKNQNVGKDSNLISLTPFIDQGIIKVGGRLKHSNLPEYQKFPIVLPKNHHVTKLIIRKEHVKLFHAGVNATLYGVREKFWPIDARNSVRHIVRQCTKCFRAKPREAQYLMGNLPKPRLNFIRPFNDVGVDFCGPFFTKELRRRNRTKIKTYVAVFVCLATKAVHLELANDLTTDAFVACLKRFLARRGMPQSIHSDNATNFVGANNEISNLFKSIHLNIRDSKTQELLKEKQISWHFIPPRAPHFGGLWEAAVKSFKTHFVRVAGNSLLTYEQLHTYVVEIEAILNSRPLSPLSSDPNDLLPLTPAHFLVGSSLTCIPQSDLRHLPENRLSCWQLAQKMRHHFWDRWYKEYINELISRTKWQSTTNQANIKPGTLVLVKEDNQPPLNWPLGRIVEVHPGSDGIIRTVTIKSATGLYKRTLKKLCPLPTEE